MTPKPAQALAICSTLAASSVFGAPPEPVADLDRTDVPEIEVGIMAEIGGGVLVSVDRADWGLSLKQSWLVSPGGVRLVDSARYDRALTGVSGPIGGVAFGRADLDDTNSSRIVLRTDGTRLGTYRLQAMDAWLDSARFGGIDGRAFVTTSSSGRARTVRFGALDPVTGALDPILEWHAERGESLAQGSFFEWQDELHFVVETPEGRRLYSSDGTREGTRLRLALDGTFYPQGGLQLPAGAWIFPAQTDAHGLEPWIWDAEGPRRFADLVPGPPSSVRWWGWARLGSQVYLGAEGGGLWRTDGTPHGTSRVENLPEALEYGQLSASERTLWGLASSEVGTWLWAFDGAGWTELGVAARATAVRPDALWAVEVFEGAPSRVVRIDAETRDIEEVWPEPAVALRAHGAEVWAFVPDGEGAVQVERFARSGAHRGRLGSIETARGAHAWPSDPIPLDDGGFAYVFWGEQGRTLARVAPDGAVTELGEARSAFVVRAPFSLGQVLVARTDDRLERVHLDGRRERLRRWRGARLRVLDLGGEALIWVSESSESGLWVSDGTPEGTRPLEIGPDARFLTWTRTREGAAIAVWAGESRVFYYDTREGLRDVSVPIEEGGPFELLDHPTGTIALITDWRVTQLVRVWPQAELVASLDGFTRAAGLTDRQAVLLDDERFVAVDLESGEELRGAYAGREPKVLGALGERLLFSARSRTEGRELWVFDGQTVAPLVDFVPGPAAGDPRDAAVIDGHLVFTAVDPDFGRETWVTDGTRDGTRLLTDLWPGPNDGVPPDLGEAGYVAIGDHVYYPGRHPEHGVEPFRLLRTALAPGPGDECRMDVDCDEGWRCVGAVCVDPRPIDVGPPPDAEPIPDPSPAPEEPPLEPPLETQNEDDGCTCLRPSAGAPGFALVLVLLGLRRRR